MEITSRIDCIKITSSELFSLVSPETYKLIEKDLLVSINKEYNETFTTFDDILEASGTMELLVSR